MTREEFMVRCANAWDEGLCEPKQLYLLSEWLDFVMRFEAGQMVYVSRFFEKENERLGGFESNGTLANDVGGYRLIKLAAILTHPCQRCATSSRGNAWWTRPAFCEHKTAAGK